MGRGRKPYIANDKDRRVVKETTLAGIDKELVSRIIGVSVPTLYKYYSDEIEFYNAQANARVAGVCFQMATSGLFPAVTIFWCKTRNGMREVQRSEIEVFDGATKITHYVDAPPTETREEWESRVKTRDL